MRWLAARRRAGELTPEAEPWIERIAADDLTRAQVTLAGYLGDPVALTLDEHEAVRVAGYVAPGTGVLRVVLDEEGGDVPAWVRGLAHFDERWVVLAQLAVAERLTAELEGEETVFDDHGFPVWDVDYMLRIARRHLGAARDALRDPSAANLTALQAYAAGAEPYGGRAVAAAQTTAVLAFAWCCESPLPDPLHLELGAADREVARTIRGALLPHVMGR